jgi:hypothetical protein
MPKQQVDPQKIEQLQKMIKAKESEEKPETVEKQ